MLGGRRVRAMDSWVFGMSWTKIPIMCGCLADVTTKAETEVPRLVQGAQPVPSGGDMDPLTDGIQIGGAGTPAKGGRGLWLRGSYARLREVEAVEPTSAEPGAGSPPAAAQDEISPTNLED